MEEEATRTEQKVKLNRGMNGKYGWEITILDKVFELKKLIDIDNSLRKTYIEEEE